MKQAVNCLMVNENIHPRLLEDTAINNFRDISNEVEPHEILTRHRSEGSSGICPAPDSVGISLS